MIILKDCNNCIELSLLAWINSIKILIKLIKVEKYKESLKIEN